MALIVRVPLDLLPPPTTVNGLAVRDRARHEARIERAAAAFAPGQALLGYRDTDKRRFQKARLAVTAMVGAAPGEFYNAGLSGGTVEDFIVMWSTMKASDRIPEVAIFGIDNWEFNKAHPQVRWLAWADDVARFVESSGAS